MTGHCVGAEGLASWAAQARGPQSQHTPCVAGREGDTGVCPALLSAPSTCPTTLGPRRLAPPGDGTTRDPSVATARAAGPLAEPCWVRGSAFPSPGAKSGHAPQVRLESVAQAHPGSPRRAGGASPAPLGPQAPPPPLGSPAVPLAFKAQLRHRLQGPTHVPSSSGWVRSPRGSPRLAGLLSDKPDSPQDWLNRPPLSSRGTRPGLVRVGFPGHPGECTGEWTAELTRWVPSSSVAVPWVQGPSLPRAALRVTPAP